MRMRKYRLFIALIALAWGASNAAAAIPQPESVAFVRVTLLSPRDRPWRVQIIAQRPGGKSANVFVGKTTANDAAAAGFAAAGQPSGWIPLPGADHGPATVRFLFETNPPLPKTDSGLAARFDFAIAAEEDHILRTVSDHDPGNVIAVRIPAQAAIHREQILTIREDTQRRLDEIKALNLPDGPRPVKLWCMTGFRSNGEFYTDPAIARMDFEIIRRLGMNGYWQQGGGQPGTLGQMAHESGIDRSTVYWRAVESLPVEKELGGATRLDWAALESFLDRVYRESVESTRREHPNGMPQIIADLMDEPAGLRFDGPEYAARFRDYLKQEEFSPDFFGKSDWNEIAPIILDWRGFFAKRGELNQKDEHLRRLFYWSAKFWNHSTARAYALATANVQRNAPGVLGTRVNFGPPWWYDYGTLPRGIDAFEFGRLQSVTLGFNEDWVGQGNPRVPLEINTFLIDFSRAAARPNRPLLGSYITADADRTSVKLRTFACLAREAKIFDFYYYGPAYTFFDHWSDKSSMVQGVAELTRDLGAADDLLWDGHAPPAQVALLYSQSWPVWKTDDTEQNELEMTYLALLHAGLPVDIVSDTEVADGRFASRRYKAIYVVNESVPARAADEIERWVKSGGHLWASGWAGMTDEYNTPTDRWNTMLGVKSRSWKPTGDLGRFGQPIDPADWKRPIFGREVTRVDAEPLEMAKPIATHNAEHHTIVLNYGKGTVQIVPRTVGKDYMDGAKEIQASLAKATIFPDDTRREIISDFAVESGAVPPATTSHNQILAWPLWSQPGGVILLANYTGAPTAELHVSFTLPMPVSKVRSLKSGELNFKQSPDGSVVVSLPMKDVTDILIAQ